MDDSMAYPGSSAAGWALPGWKATLGHLAAVLAALPFLVAGVWKITEPFGASVRLTQALVPPDLALAGAVCFGIAELLGGVLIIVPRFRRWGALIISLLLVAFMIYIGMYYHQLTGEDCNCFPWIKRAVGPGFFISDGLMLVFAVLAGWWAKPSTGVRSALLVLLAISVFAGTSFGMAAVRSAAIKAPALIKVEGRHFALREGKVVLFFFNPECMHCAKSAEDMSRWSWNDTTIVAVATEQAQFGRVFLKDNGLNARLADDYGQLRTVFPVTLAPYGVALENGQVKSELNFMDPKQPEDVLRRGGFIR